MIQANIVHNVDLVKLGAFRTFLEENPDKGQLKLWINSWTNPTKGQRNSRLIQSITDQIKKQEF